MLAGQHEEAVTSSRNSNNSITGANLLNGVEKSYGNGEKILNSSKVVDENGEPLIVFHGTRNGGFNVFDTSKAEEPRLVKTKNAFWFTDSKQMAESFSGENETNFRGKNPMTYKCFLDMRNPLVVDFEGKSWGESIYGSTDEIVRKAQDEGYDGVILKNVRDGGMYGQFLTKGNEYIVFEPNQIKSATDNIGTFDKANPDIRYSRPYSADIQHYRSQKIPFCRRVAPWCDRASSTLTSSHRYHQDASLESLRHSFNPTLPLAARWG